MWTGKPGTKFDQVLILEGAQGSGKSSALRILGGEWHSDAELGRVEGKDASIVLQGCWIFELGEMTAMGRSEIEALKAFLSRNDDRYRGPYERTAKSAPRRCVFIGTTNADGYLRDTTGNRRFWPVHTDKIDLEKLAADRDQLWAEAAAAEASGESLELQPALREVASDAQQSRLINDPWADTLADCLQRLGETRVHTAALLYELGIPPGQQTQYQAKRLREVMVSLGWKYKKGIRVGGKILAGYEAPDGWTSTVPDVGDQSP